MRMTENFPDLTKSTIGFESVSEMLTRMMHLEPSDGYPPYNIEKNGEDHYRITIAAAGFSKEELAVTVEDDQLTVTGHKLEPKAEKLIYKGIASRNFRLQFDLAQYVEIVSAKLENGLLEIDLERKLPEKLKRRQISIQNGKTAQAKAA